MIEPVLNIATRVPGESVSQIQYTQAPIVSNLGYYTPPAPAAPAAPVAPINAGAIQSAPAAQNVVLPQQQQQPVWATPSGFLAGPFWATPSGFLAGPYGTHQAPAAAEAVVPQSVYDRVFSEPAAAAPLDISIAASSVLPEFNAADYEPAVYDGTSGAVVPVGTILEDGVFYLGAKDADGKPVKLSDTSAELLGGLPSVAPSRYKPDAAQLKALEDTKSVSGYFDGAGKPTGAGPRGGLDYQKWLHRMAALNATADYRQEQAGLTALAESVFQDAKAGDGKYSGWAANTADPNNKFGGGKEFNPDYDQYKALVDRVALTYKEEVGAIEAKALPFEDRVLQLAGAESGRNLSLDELAKSPGFKTLVTEQAKKEAETLGIPSGDVEPDVRGKALEQVYNSRIASYDKRIAEAGEGTAAAAHLTKAKERLEAQYLDLTSAAKDERGIELAPLPAVKREDIRAALHAFNPRFADAEQALADAKQARDDYAASAKPGAASAQEAARLSRNVTVAAKEAAYAERAYRRLEAAITEEPGLYADSGGDLEKFVSAYYERKLKDGSGNAAVDAAYAARGESSPDVDVQRQAFIDAGKKYMLGGDETSPEKVRIELQNAMRVVETNRLLATVEGISDVANPGFTVSGIHRGNITASKEELEQIQKTLMEYGSVTAAGNLSKVISALSSDKDIIVAPATAAAVVDGFDAALGIPVDSVPEQTASGLAEGKEAIRIELEQDLRLAKSVFQSGGNKADYEAAVQAAKFKAKNTYSQLWNTLKAVRLPGNNPFGWRTGDGKWHNDYSAWASFAALGLALYEPFERRSEARRAERRADRRYDEDWERLKEGWAIQNGYRLQQIGAAGEASRGGGSVAAVRPARF